MSDAGPRPSTLGRYELITKIGQGGMAEVQLALQRGPGGFEKLVVVKLIHQNLATQKTFVDLLLDEARVAALVKHPNVIDIYDLGQADGHYFIAMEYLEGEPFLELLRAGRDGSRLDPLSTARLVADTAEGLDAAHELRSLSGEPMGLVHHDVSLGNIVVLYNGQAKLVDFGVAKATMNVAEQSKIAGKYGYMAPEKLRSSGGDRRSDIWSLGVVLWEALTLRRLFRGRDEQDTIRQVLELPIPAPSQVNSEVCAELDPIVMHALQRDPDQRYGRANDIARDIEHVLRLYGYGGRNDQIAHYMHATFATRIAARKKLVQEVSSKGRASPDVLEAVFSDYVLDAATRTPKPVRVSDELAVRFKSPSDPPPAFDAPARRSQPRISAVEPDAVVQPVISVGTGRTPKPVIEARAGRSSQPPTTMPMPAVLVPPTIPAPPVTPPAAPARPHGARVSKPRLPTDPPFELEPNTDPPFALRPPTQSEPFELAPPDEPQDSRAATLTDIPPYEAETDTGSEIDLAAASAAAAAAIDRADAAIDHAAGAADDATFAVPVNGDATLFEPPPIAADSMQRRLDAELAAEPLASDDARDSMQLRLDAELRQEIDAGRIDSLNNAISSTLDQFAYEPTMGAAQPLRIDDTPRPAKRPTIQPPLPASPEAAMSTINLPNPPAAPASRRWPLVVVALLLVGAILGALVYFVFLQDEDAPSSPTPETMRPAPSQPTTPPLPTTKQPTVTPGSNGSASAPPDQPGSAGSDSGSAATTPAGSGSGSASGSGGSASR